MRGVLPALKNMQGFAGDLAVMANRAGSTDEAFKKMSNTLSAKLDSLKQAALGALSMIGEALADNVGRAAKMITSITGNIQTFIQKNKSLVVSIANGIVVASKYGWDYLWCRYRPTVDETTGLIVEVPTSAHVDRVYKPVDFSLLLI